MSRPVAAFAAVLFAGPALAQDAHHIDDVRVDVHVDAGGYGSLGIGIRADIPLLRDGILANTDDELALSPGADMFFSDFYPDYYGGGPYVIPSVVLQWNFYLAPNWSVFPEAGVAFYVGDRHWMRRERSVYAVADLGLGARYHFSPRNALLARISTPTGLQLGVTF